MNKLPQELWLIVSKEVKGDLNKLIQIIVGKIEARERALNSTSQASGSLNKDVPTGTTLIPVTPTFRSAPTVINHIHPVLVEQ